MATTINADNVTGGAVITGDGSGILGLQTTGTTRITITAAGDVGIGTSTPGSKLTVDGIIESTSSGFKFPDGTTQTTAFTGDSPGGKLYLYNNFGGF